MQSKTVKIGGAMFRAQPMVVVDAWEVGRRIGFALMMLKPADSILKENYSRAMVACMSRIPKEDVDWSMTKLMGDIARQIEGGGGWAPIDWGAEMSAGDLTLEQLCQLQYWAFDVVNWLVSFFAATPSATGKTAVADSSPPDSRAA
jgi:hypothetical protein